MKKLVLAAAALTTLFSGCGPMTRADQIAALTGNATAGGMLYTSQACVSCHGAEGKGTSSGISLIEPAKNDSKVALINVLINGVPNTGMVSYAALSNQQLADLTTYVKGQFGK